jgi:hypothetical protein
MSKIPVGGTILQGYGFALRRIVANLGLSWLAAVFYAVATGYWLHQFCTTMLVSPHPGSELNDFALFDLFGFVVTTALGSAVLARALTGAALEPGETMTAYFAIAKREWLLFLSLLLLYAVVIAASFAVVFLSRFGIAIVQPMINAKATWHGIGALPAMNAAVAFVAFAAVATLAVRLGFFAAPVASAERSMNMARAWSLSRGNSWRAFGVVVVLSVPALLLWAAAEWALIGGDLANALTTAQSPSHNSTPLYQLIDGNAAAIAVVWTLLLVVLNMLFAGASAPAYRIVRDNATAWQTRSVPSMPALDPAFAGSFAGFAPRHAKAPGISEVEAAPPMQSSSEVFAAVPAPQTETPATTAEVPVETNAAVFEPVDAQLAEASATPVAEPEGTVPPLESAAPLPEIAEEPHAVLAAAPMEDAHQSTAFADDVHDAIPVAASGEAVVTQFPLGPDETPQSVEAEHADPYAEFAEHHADSVEHHAEAAEPHAETGEVIPLPSHGDETESSPQNVPSEAA